MPALKPEYEVLAKAVSGRLRGDPSLPLDEEPEEEAPVDDEEEVSDHEVAGAREACQNADFNLDPTCTTSMKVLLDLSGILAASTDSVFRCLVFLSSSYLLLHAR